MRALGIIGAAFALSSCTQAPTNPSKVAPRYVHHNTLKLTETVLNNIPEARLESDPFRRTKPQFDNVLPVSEFHLDEPLWSCGGALVAKYARPSRFIHMDLIHSQETWVPIDGTTTTTIVFRFHQNSMNSLDLGDDYR